MMPGQEKMVMDFYQKNPSAVASLRGTVYEDKIINLIKEKAKPNKKELTKDEAEKILKDSQKQTELKTPVKSKSTSKKETKTSVKTKTPVKKTTKTSSKSKSKTKKVSKK
jgi:trigger factor